MDPISKGEVGEPQTRSSFNCIVRLNYFRIIILGQWFATGVILSPRGRWVMCGYIVGRHTGMSLASSGLSLGKG